MSQQGMRTFSTEFKQAVVLRLEAGERIAAVGAELKARRKLLYEWRAAYRKLGAAGLNRKRGRKPGGARASPDAAPAPLTELARAQALIAELECKIGKQQMDLVFFAKPCGSSTRGTFRLARRHLRGHRRNERAGDARRPLDRASVPARRRVARRLLSLWRGSRAQADGSGSARQDPQKIALENRFYGYRRVCRDLWRIHGLKVNHKHVLRLMREDNLLCLRQKPFVPYTTNS